MTLRTALIACLVLPIAVVHAATNRAGGIAKTSSNPYLRVIGIACGDHPIYQQL